MEILTAAQMQAVERAAMDSGAATGLELMERAGRGVVEAICEWRPELAAAPGRAVVLCGPGNNGGDGYVVARLLAERGWSICVMAYRGAATPPPDAARNRERWLEIGDVLPLGAAPQADLYVDALFGAGLTRPLDDELKVVWGDGRNEIIAKTIAIDGPSGLCLDSGRALGFVMPAAATCTFQRGRCGHVLGEGPEACGMVFVKDIGLDPLLEPDADQPVPPRPFARIAAPDVALLAKGAPGHKYDHGHALVLAGGVGKGGAARLAARGALRMGAGLVTVGAPPSALIENAAQLNAVMLARVEGPGGLAAVLEDPRINSIVLGPGLGVSDGTRDLVKVALAARRGVVLDADALTAFADEPEGLFEASAGGKAVLTPHMGEFRRLFPDLSERLAATPVQGPAYSKIDAARDAAKRAGCVLILKGPDTVVADDTGAASVVSAAYERACPWLATAGAGDVLSGFIGGLIARGAPPFAAAEIGAWLHQQCAIEFGPGLIAEDLPETLPAVFRKAGL